MNDLRNKLLHLLTMNYGNDNPGVFDRIPKVNEWSEIFQIARRECVGALTYHTLVTQKLTKLLPSNILAEFEGEYKNGLMRNIYLHEQFDCVLKIFDDQEIKALVFKGVALGKTVYPHIGLRIFSDMDILVHEEDYELACNTLTANGFTALSDNAPDYFSNLMYCEKTFIKPSVINVVIDVHNSINYLGCSVDKNGFTNSSRSLRNGVRVESDDLRIAIMSPEDSILNLLAHQYFECKLEPLALYCDIGYLIKQNVSIDWSYIIEIAENVAGGEYLLDRLSAIVTELGYKISCLESVANEGHYNKNDKAIESFLRCHARVQDANVYERFKGIEKYSEKINFIKRYLWPSSSYMTQAYSLRDHRGLDLYLTYWRRILRILFGSIVLIFSLSSVYFKETKIKLVNKLYRI